MGSDRPERQVDHDRRFLDIWNFLYVRRIAKGANILVYTNHVEQTASLDSIRNNSREGYSRSTV